MRAGLVQEHHLVHNVVMLLVGHVQQHLPHLHSSICKHSQAH